MNDQSQISARHDPFETQANSAMMNGVKESASDAAGVVKRTLSATHPNSNSAAWVILSPAPLLTGSSQ